MKNSNKLYYSPQKGFIVATIVKVTPKLYPFLIGGCDSAERLFIFARTMNLYAFLEKKELTVEFIREAWDKFNGPVYYYNGDAYPFRDTGTDDLLLNPEVS